MAFTIPEKISKELGSAIAQGDKDGSVREIKEALKQKTDPLALIQQVIIPTLTDVGRRFEELEIFLPELIAAGEAGSACSQVIEETLVNAGSAMEAEGVLVIGTVKGDIHDIGKNIVACILKAHGYKVIDLGKDVDAATFVQAAEENKADVIAASALMSITRAGCRDVANLLRELNLTNKYQFIVGGGSIDQQYADEIGANGYAESASGAVELVKLLLSTQKGG